MDYLNDQEKAAIEVFNGSPVMLGAVKKVLLRSIYHQFEPGKPVNELENLAFVFVSQNPSLSDEILGANLRALWQGVNALAAGFNKLSTIKREDETPSKPNKAR